MTVESQNIARIRLVFHVNKTFRQAIKGDVAYCSSPLFLSDCFFSLLYFNILLNPIGDVSCLSLTKRWHEPIFLVPSFSSSLVPIL
jgi:hypothetical protein